MTPADDLRPASDSEIVDLAGRQRMLNQRVMKEYLARLVGAPETLINPKRTSTILRTTAERLARGGPIAMKPGMPPDMRIHRLTRDDIAAAFEEQIDLSIRVVEAGQTLLDMTMEDPGVAEQLAHLLALGDDLHRVADTAVKMLTVHYQREKAALEDAERALTTSMKSILQVITHQSAELVSSSSRLTANSERMTSSAGDTSSQASLASDSVLEMQEMVGSVAAALEEMSATTREVSSRTSAAAEQATLATETVQDASSAVARLADSSEQIGEVAGRLFDRRVGLQRGSVTHVDTARFDVDESRPAQAVEQRRGGLPGRADPLRQLSLGEPCVDHRHVVDRGAERLGELEQRVGESLVHPFGRQRRDLRLARRKARGEVASQRDRGPGRDPSSSAAASTSRRAQGASGGAAASAARTASSPGGPRRARPAPRSAASTPSQSGPRRPRPLPVDAPPRPCATTAWAPKCCANSVSVACAW